jgi:6-phosphogluconolactonase
MIIGPLLLAMSVNLETFYIGTYTSSGKSEGIYQAVLNRETGQISGLKLAAKASNPSFLAVDARRQRIFAVHEDNEGTVSSYKIAASGDLKLLNTRSTRGAHPCHVSVDRSGRAVLVANYSSGSVVAFPVLPDGSLGESSGFYQNRGNGPNADRQSEPHMHSIYPEADGAVTYACDLGTDEVLMFVFDSSHGTIDISEARGVKLAGGSGPRHLAISPNGRFVYVNTELSNSVWVFARDEYTYELRPIQTLSSLPAGHRGNSATAEIACHPNGKWVYVSNRGHDSIAKFKVRQNGTLEEAEMVKVPAEPRGFAIDPSGRWLVVGGQRSDEIVAMPIDPKSGSILSAASVISISKPVCVVFS